jgi:hypothetical protein
MKRAISEKTLEAKWPIMEMQVKQEDLFSDLAMLKVFAFVGMILGSWSPGVGDGGCV